MFQQPDDAEQLPARRRAYPLGLGRQRYALLHERQAEHGYLAYVLLLIFLFQTFLLSCVTLLLGAFVLFNYVSFTSHTQAVEQLAVALTRVALPASDPAATGTPVMLTPALPIAPAGAVTATVALIPALPTAANVATPFVPLPPTPTLAPGPASPLAPPTDPAHPASEATPPAASPELQVYATQVLPPLNNLSAAMDRLRELAQNPNLDDQQWVADITAQLTMIQDSHGNLTAIQSPPSLLEVHNNLVNAVGICQTAADFFRTSIANHNTDNLNTAVAYTQTCFAQFPGAAQQMREALQAAVGHS